MIGYIEGKLLKIESDSILLLVNHIGYEILLPAGVMETVCARDPGDELSLFIYYYQTERQPKPVLIGFNSEIEKEFFQYFISVEDIGPLKAVKALDQPVGNIARAIEERDVAALKKLKGIGPRTAQKIIASLEGKMGKFALISDKKEVPSPDTGYDFIPQVIEVLVSQLGYKTTEAKQLIIAAQKRNPEIGSPEELFDEIYRGETK